MPTDMYVIVVYNKLHIIAWAMSSEKCVWKISSISFEIRLHSLLCTPVFLFFYFEGIQNRKNSQNWFLDFVIHLKQVSYTLY